MDRPGRYRPDGLDVAIYTDIALAHGETKVPVVHRGLADRGHEDPSREGAPGRINDHRGALPRPSERHREAARCDGGKNEEAQELTREEAGPEAAGTATGP